MSATLQGRKSAKIYQFPVGGRRAIGAGMRPVAVEVAKPLVPVLAGSGWYHEAAMQAEADRKN